MAENNIRPYESMDKLRSKNKKLVNQLRIKDRQRYMARTLKAGADEFNNARLKIRPSGVQPTTGEVARMWNLGKTGMTPIRNGDIGGAALGIMLGRAAGNKIGSELKKLVKEKKNERARQTNMYGRY